jgi:hypothetical protein
MSLKWLSCSERGVCHQSRSCESNSQLCPEMAIMIARLFPLWSIVHGLSSKKSCHQSRSCESNSQLCAEMAIMIARLFPLWSIVHGLSSKKSCHQARSCESNSQLIFWRFGMLVLRSRSLSAVVRLLSACGLKSLVSGSRGLLVII